MKAILPDFHTEGLEAVLHEKQGGWAERDKTVQGLTYLARAEGVDLREGVEVTGFDIRGGKVHAVETTRGSIAAEMVIVAPGPWAARFWQMLCMIRVYTKEPGHPAEKEKPFTLDSLTRKVRESLDAPSANGAAANGAAPS